MSEDAVAYATQPGQMRAETAARSEGQDQEPARTLILSLTELECATIRDPLETLNPDGDEATEIADRAARKVTDAWEAAGQDGGITTTELALLESNAWADTSGFDTLAAKVKAAQAGQPVLWRDYLITGGRLDSQIADLRGSMIDGYDDDRVNRILGAISDATGLDLVCVWAYYDAAPGTGGNSQFYVQGKDGQLSELAGGPVAVAQRRPRRPRHPSHTREPAHMAGGTRDVHHRRARLG